MKGEAMSFVEQADSWRSKAHVSGSRLPALVGITLVILAIAIFAGYNLITATTNEALVIEETLQTTSDTNASPDVSEKDSLPTPEASPQTTPHPSSSDTPDNTIASNTSSISNATSSFVHVGGCVVSPGVVELPTSSRVSDAIAAAGGFSDNAAPDALNLARLISDGEQIIVPSLEEYEVSKPSFDATAANTADLSQADGTTASSNTSATDNNLININTASSAELQTLNGIGPSTAEKIIADREASGPFGSIEDLMRVSGIGEKKFASLAPYICVG